MPVRGGLRPDWLCFHRQLTGEVEQCHPTAASRRGPPASAAAASTEKKTLNEAAAPLRAAQAAKQAPLGGADEQFRQLFSNWQSLEKSEAPALAAANKRVEAQLSAARDDAQKRLDDAQTLYELGREAEDADSILEAADTFAGFGDPWFSAQARLVFLDRTGADAPLK